MIERIVVINDLASPMGGASQLAVQSTIAFEERDIPVTFISGDIPPSEPFASEHVCLGQKRLLARGKMQSLLSGIYNPAAESLLADWIAKNDTDGTVYHLHGWSQILSPSIFKALKPVMNRVIVTAHDFFLACPNGAQFNFPAREICSLKPMSRACMTTNCDRRNPAQKAWRLARQAVQQTLLAPQTGPEILLIHARMGQFLERAGYPSAKLHTLPNPIRPYTDRRVAAETNEAVLFVGRMEKTKGVDRLAQACAEAKIPLIALGDGVLLQDLREQYPQFEFPGRVEPRNIGEFAQRSRLLVMPSLHMEPFGLSAVEALWSGLPVLSSHSSLIAPDIEEAGAGLSIDPCDGPAFAQTLAELGNDDGRIKQMSEIAFSATGHLANRFDDWIDALLRHYRKTLGEAACITGASPGQKDARKTYREQGEPA